MLAVAFVCDKEWGLSLLADVEVVACPLMECLPLNLYQNKNTPLHTLSQDHIGPAMQLKWCFVHAYGLHMLKLWYTVWELKAGLLLQV